MVSIIVIAYNEEKYIDGILSSLAQQSFNRFEVIIVDSNSTDNTKTVAQRFQHHFNEFTYLELDCTKGPAYARNKGVESARYNRLLFLDADTRLSPSFLEKALSEIDHRKLDIASCPVKPYEKGFVSIVGAKFLNMFMLLLKPLYITAYGGCLFSTKELHLVLNGFYEYIAVCEDCNYVARAVKQHVRKFGFLGQEFFASDRRAKSEGGMRLLLLYIRIHLYRMCTRKEILKGHIDYKYGKF